MTPSLYDWMGGGPALERVIGAFYAAVAHDAVLAPVFATMSPAHVVHVSAFIAEVFGGPTAYSQHHGGHAEMIRHHLGRTLSEVQRKRWVDLLLETADHQGVPADPEFRSALVGYLEWGSRLAVINSQSGAAAVEDAAMPTWGWGEVKGPYRPPT
ncbi:MAG: group II truncated hemoglobin [Kofleriaceae bacterium]